MRFIVFIDLFGTIILPATCAYLGYLIYKVATHSGQFPLISIVMIAALIFWAPKDAGVPAEQLYTLFGGIITLALGYLFGRSAP